MSRSPLSRLTLPGLLLTLTVMASPEGGPAWAGDGEAPLAETALAGMTLPRLPAELLGSIDFEPADADRPRAGDPPAPDYRHPVASQSSSQPAGLESLFTEARGYSLRLAAAAAREEAEARRVDAARMAFLPTVGLAADATLAGDRRYSAGSAVTAGLAERSPSRLGVEMTLPLYDGMKRLNTLRAARALAEAGRHQSAGERQQLYLDTATAGLAVLRDRAVLALRQRAVALRRELAERTTRLVAEEAATRTDAATAASALDLVTSQLEGARADLEASELAFARIVGHRPPARLTLAVPAADLPGSADAAAALAEAGGPAGRVARLAAIAAGYKAEATAADMLPKLDLVATAGVEYGTTPYIDRTEDLTLMLKFRMPIVDFASGHLTDAARAEARQRRYEAQDTIRDAGLTARTLYARRQALIAEMTALQRQTADARKVVEGMRIERDSGNRTLLEVLTAETGLVESEVALASAAFERDRAAFQLLAEAGRLGPAADRPGS